MSVTGRIAVDVQFADATTAAGVQSLKTITLQDAAEYTSGKVAIISGTVGTSVATVALAPTSYKDASGAAVSFAVVTRLAFAATPEAVVFHGDLNGSDSYTGSRGGRVSVNEANHSAGTIEVSATAGTAAYTLILYGT